MRCLTGVQLEHLTLTGRPEMYSESSSARERFVRAQRDRHEHEHGRHRHEVLQRHNEENVVGIDATVLERERERLGMVTMVAASREEGKTSSAETAA